MGSVFGTVLPDSGSLNTIGPVHQQPFYTVASHHTMEDPPVATAGTAAGAGAVAPRSSMGSGGGCGSGSIPRRGSGGNPIWSSTPFDLHQNGPNPPQAAGPRSSQLLRRMRCRCCTISLFIWLLVPILVISAIYFPVTWWALNRASVASIDSMSERLHQVTSLHVQTVISDFLDMMSAMAHVVSVVANHDMDIAHTQQLFINLIQSMDPNFAFLLFGLPNGYAFTVKRMADGGLALGVRPADCNMSTQCSNLTYTYIDAQGQATDRFQSSVVFDPRTRPWYKDAVRNGQPAFTAPYLHPSTGDMGVSLGTPLFRNDGSLYAVVGVDYLFSHIAAHLLATQTAIQTSGALLLVNHDGQVLASSGTVSAIDLHVILSDWQGNDKPTEHEIEPFGKSIVLQVAFDSSAATSTLKTVGLDWRVIVVIPKSDYFAILDDQKRVQTGLISGCLGSFFVVMSLMMYFSISLPLRSLQRNLMGLRDMLQRQSCTNILVCPEHPGTASMFSELSALHRSIMVVIKAAEEAAQERAVEMAVTAEKLEAQEESQRLMRAKEMFFAMMSHEMRTPLTACIGMAEVLLAMPNLTDQQRECAQAIAMSGGALVGLVNDVLDFSKLEAEKLVLENLPFNIRDCVEHSASVLQVKADEKNVELIVVINSDVPMFTMGDPNRLRQVLFNLLSNALKFTAKGFVCLSCAFDVPTLHLKFEVRDTGIGLRPETIPQLFQPFVQADSTTSRKFGGTGLGLVISKRIVAMMGGNLDVKSDGEGQGSTFFFSVPYVMPTSIAAARRQSLMSSAGAHRPSAWFIPESPMLSRGLSVESYCMPLRASAALRSSPRSGDRPAGEHRVLGEHRGVSVIVVDKLEPRRVAVCELLRTARVHFYPFKSVEHLQEISVDEPPAFAPFVIVPFQDFSGMPPSQIVQLFATSCCARNIERVVILVASMKHIPTTGSVSPSTDRFVFVSKPLTLAKLRRALSTFHSPTGADVGGGAGVGGGSCNLVRHRTSSTIITGSEDAEGGFGHRTASASTAAGGMPLPMKEAKILIVDDVVVNQRVMTLKLQQRGYTNIDTASSGAEALQMVSANINPTYSLIFMDVCMPEMDGYQTTRLIKAKERYNAVPVIALTGVCTVEDFDACIASGMQAVLIKPVDTDQMMSLLKTYLEQQMQQQDASLQRTVSAASTDSGAAVGIISAEKEKKRRCRSPPTAATMSGNLLNVPTSTLQPPPISILPVPIPSLQVSPADGAGASDGLPRNVSSFGSTSSSKEGGRSPPSAPL